ncbi:hypothetical protein EDD86DRAFT_213147 [Gorgonomyces haynaldii]|nr:hypothetical protein EDD86DRAFT_213147 [Gorgonomyces haynaldii]
MQQLNYSFKLPTKQLMRHILLGESLQPLSSLTKHIQDPNVIKLFNHQIQPDELPSEFCKKTLLHYCVRQTIQNQTHSQSELWNLCETHDQWTLGNHLMSAAALDDRESVLKAFWLLKKRKPSLMTLVTAMHAFIQIRADENRYHQLLSLARPILDKSPEEMQKLFFTKSITFLSTIGQDNQVIKMLRKIPFEHWTNDQVDLLFHIMQKKDTDGTQMLEILLPYVQDEPKLLVRLVDHLSRLDASRTVRLLYKQHTGFQWPKKSLTKISAQFGLLEDESVLELWMNEAKQDKPVKHLMAAYISAATKVCASENVEDFIKRAKQTIQSVSS